MKKSALAIVTLSLILGAARAQAEAPAPAATATAQAQTAAHPSTKLELATEADPALPLGWVAAISVALAGAVLLVHLKKQGLVGKGSASKEALRVVASKQLGPKAKIVLVETRGREILLSVGDRGATLVSDWWLEDDKRDEVKDEPAKDDLALDDRIELADLRPLTRETPAVVVRTSQRPAPAPAPAPAAPAPAPAPMPTASAVAGLMRLRTKSSARPTKPAAPAPHMDLAADLYGQWSKHLLNR